MKLGSKSLVLGVLALAGTVSSFSCTALSLTPARRGEGGVITYLAGGKQYVGIAEGITSNSFKTKGGNARVAVYGLP